MKVLFFPHVEHYTLGLSRELTNYINIWILSVGRLETPSNQIILPNIPKIRGILRVFSLKILSKLFDVIHVNDAISGMYVKRYTGIYNKMIITEHGYPDPKLEHESTSYIASKERDALLHLYNKGVPIVTISNYSAQMLRKKYDIKVQKVIYHGLLDNFRFKEHRELKNDIPIILWASRLIPMKEPMILLEALKNIHKKLNFKVVIRGDGPLREIMEEYIRKQKLTNKIIFQNRVPFNRLPFLYDSATIFVHTSSYEPFGLCILEAMGSGLPVIVPKAGGAYEIAGPGAVNFSPHSSKDLGEKIMSILTDPDLYHRLSIKSLERSRFFTWQKSAKEYLMIYKRLYNRP